MIKTIGIITVLAAMAATPRPAADGQVWQGAASCRFVAPVSLGTARVEWTGKCLAGKAEGLGMLRPRGPDARDIAFYGKVVKGRADIGIVELQSGFKAGKLVNGDIETGSDMDERDRAFETGAAAARQVSQHFAAIGKQPSSAYYRRKADFFLLQIE